MIGWPVIAPALQLALRRAGRDWTAAFADALRTGALRWPSRPEDPEEE